MKAIQRPSSLVINAVELANHAASIQLNCYKADGQGPLGTLRLCNGLRAVSSML